MKHGIATLAVLSLLGASVAAERTDAGVGAQIDGAELARSIIAADGEARQRLFDRWTTHLTRNRAEAEQPGTILWECTMCPPMTVVPAGAYTIGSPLSERGRADDEGPRTTVTIGRAFAVSRFEVTRTEYEAFLRAANHPVGAGCISDRAERGNWQPDGASSLRDPGYRQEDMHPVVCVSWHDAQAYVDWLNRVTPGGYRLLTEAEWEYAARAGVTTAYLWGDGREEACSHMNGSDARLRAKYPEPRILPVGEDAPCDDGALNTTRIGSYRPNGFGLHDMSGNVAEWVQDCETPDYATLPRDGAPVAGECARRMVRGGSWGTYMRQLRLAERIRYAPDTRDDSIGIRVALTLG